VRWLAIDYLDHVQGECEKSFPWETKIPGFTAEVRASEFAGGDTDAPVRHKRVEYRMPDTTPRDHLLKLRDQVEKALKGNTIRRSPGEQKLLFEFGSSSDTAFKAWIRVRAPLQVVPGTGPHAGTEDPGAPRKLELHIPTITDDPYRSVGVMTQSELPAGDHLVGLLHRPDGRMEEIQSATTIYAGSRRLRVMRHLIWPMTLFESNRVRGILEEMRAAVDGQVVQLKPDERARVFQATNDHGYRTEGFVALRSQTLSVTGLPPAYVSIADTPQNYWPHFLSVKLKVSAQPGSLLYAVGLSGDGMALETSTSIMRRSTRAWAGDSCYWYYPRDFQAEDIGEIIRQLESTKATSPNGIQILPGQRVPVFAVTNQAGAIFRGYFERPMTAGKK